MTEWIVRLIEWGGYWGIIVLMALENIFPPLPSEAIMGLGGILVARGAMQFWPLLLAGTLGTVVGNYFWFLLGDRFGYQRLEPLVRRWGRWLTVEWHDVERASHFLRRHGQWVVFGLRFSPFFRTLISVPAGLSHMNHARFLVFTAGGSAIWNALLILGGHWLGATLADAERWLIYLTVAIGAGTLVVYLWRLSTWKPRGPVEQDALGP
ncbi:MAG: DedA family protein [Novosphingobium sp.]